MLLKLPAKALMCLKKEKFPFKHLPIRVYIGTWKFRVYDHVQQKCISY